jgi:hypothetical protein
MQKPFLWSLYLLINSQMASFGIPTRINRKKIATKAPREKITLFDSKNLVLRDRQKSRFAGVVVHRLCLSALL